MSWYDRDRALARRKPRRFNGSGEALAGFSQNPLAASPIQCYNSDMDAQEREVRITIRIPAEIAEALRRLAKQHDRSLNGEIVRALREYAEKHKGEK